MTTPSKTNVKDLKKLFECGDHGNKKTNVSPFKGYSPKLGSKTKVENEIKAINGMRADSGTPVCNETMTHAELVNKQKVKSARMETTAKAEESRKHVEAQRMEAARVAEAKHEAALPKASRTGEKQNGERNNPVQQGAAKTPPDNQIKPADELKVAAFTDPPALSSEELDVSASKEHQTELPEEMQVTAPSEQHPVVLNDAQCTESRAHEESPKKQEVGAPKESISTNSKELQTKVEENNVRSESSEEEVTAIATRTKDLDQATGGSSTGDLSKLSDGSSAERAEAVKVTVDNIAPRTEDRNDSDNPKENQQGLPNGFEDGDQVTVTSLSEEHDVLDHGMKQLQLDTPAADAVDSCNNNENLQSLDNVDNKMGYPQQKNLKSKAKPGITKKRKRGAARNW